MTPRERLLHFLAGEPCDRVPIWLLFPYAPLGCYVDVWGHPGYRRVLDASLGRAVVLNRRGLQVPFFTPEVTITQEDVDGGSCTRYRYRGHELVSSVRQTPDGTTHKPLLTTDKELEIFCSLPVLTEPHVLHRHLHHQLVAYRADMDAFPIELGAMMLDLGEPINALHHASEPAALSMWSLTHDALIRRHLDAVMERQRVIYAWTLKHRLAEVYFMVGSELASPPMFSRTTFLNWIVPYAQELIANIHRAGCRVIQHYHGQIGLILPDFLTMGADALHTIEEPPIGDCTLEQAFHVVGDRLGLIGCIQYDCFREYTPDRMRAAARDQLRRTQGQRFMLAPSAGPFDPEPSARVIDNYLAFLQVASPAI